ncbi:hypothetical protein FHR99_002671 [Litorivivens lipolytica]|uniref:Uncharacterized protein n=1 Tax=Litorivivens lipolytica TaxID=1524264 RepID=A0A7W4W6K8_9GAMM|nr:hypothetical protein [Litorivivens lipolytica]MBB3048397.1 hypothetical protein [Litorivivens lipolytica]
MPDTSPPRLTRDEWESRLNAMLDAHFSAARERVPDVCARHFHSLGGVAKRHWQHRRDIPRDLATIPRFTWRALRRLGGRKVATEPRYSAKELALAGVIAGELLHLASLEESLLKHLGQHPELDPSKQREVEALLARYSPAELERRVRAAVARLAVDHEGSRDIILFITLGVAGRLLSDKIAFGSAGILGATAASSLYLSQQSYFSALWAKWFGLPGWVSVTGGAVGFMALILLTPVVAPLVECGINRFRAERTLLRLIDEVQRQLQSPGSDGYTLAAYAGTYVQLLPDLLNILRSLR